MATNGVPNGLHDPADDELDIDYSDIEERYRVRLQDSFDNLIVVDGAPVVEESRREKLIKAITSTFNKKGIPLGEGKIEMPEDEEKKSKGFMFIELESAQDADRAVRTFNDYPFDKRHRFTVVKFSDVERYSSVSENFAEPPLEEFKPRGHLKSWVADPAGRDQMVLYQGDDVRVAWHGRTGAPEVVQKRTRWTDAYTAWSPDGTYLSTVHNQGVAIWGGANFDRIHRLYHPQVKLIDWSPYGNYLVTWSDAPIDASVANAPPVFTDDDDGNSIAVWEVSSGKLLRTFPQLQQPNEPGGRIKVQWPMFKWSGDEKYLARVTPGQAISVYEAPGMGLLDKKSVKIEGVVDFEWQPLSDKEREALEEEQKDATKKPAARQNTLAYWMPEVANQPARVSLMSIPSRDTIRSKNLFNVSDCKIHWQSNGDYLCVKVDRHTKTKKTTYCNLEIFRMRDKAVPIDVVELKDMVTAFAWEPKGNKFLLITSNDPNLAQGPTPGVTIKTAVSFYGIDPKKGDFRAFKSFDGKTSNSIYWSPKGRHVVAATLGSSSKCDLEFWDTDLEDSSQDLGAGISLLASVEQYGMTEVEWDPSGRYISAVGSSWMNSLEPGYAIYDFKGESLAKVQLDRFKQLVWRPRPRTLLSKEQQRKVRKNLREYSRQFEQEDELEQSSASAELVAHRRRLLDEWDAWRSQSKKSLAEERKQLGWAAPVQKTQAVETVEEWIEEIIDEKEELIG